MEIAEGETVVLLGTSGSGKTTTMKMVNRLIEPTEGRILVQGEDVQQKDLITLRRHIGYAIQHIGLFPHMSVGENIGVVPNLLGWKSNRVRERVSELLSMVGLEPEEYAARYPHQLSGGQRQRIGVARALAADPPLILMDEPFGALDPITREVLQDSFIDLLQELRKTVIFVTHDLFEAVKVGDRVALMNEGRIRQLATPAELVEKPADEFVESFLGQHRFQLAMLTRSIGSLMPEQAEAGKPFEGDEKIPRLNARHSLVDALDAFKSSGRLELPVLRRGQYIGRLSKRELLEAMTEILGAATE